jgi:hypothetical protein
LWATGGAGGDALHSFNSSLNLIQNSIYGGNGGDAGWAFEWSTGGKGSNGLYAEDSYLFVDSSIYGGSGGHGEHFGGDGGSSVYLKNSISEIFDSTLVGGGIGFGPYFDGEFGYGVSGFDSVSEIVNSTLKGEVFNEPFMFYNDYALYLKGDTNSTLLNSDFNETKIYFKDTCPTLYVKWYLHINTIDNLIQPIPNATVCIKDYLNSLPVLRDQTDSEGHIHWLVETEYIEKDTDGDTIGERTYHTPHRITAWNETLMGYTEVKLNESKEVNVVLGTPSYEIPLSAGWNLISIPLVQSDTYISTVLSSIVGNYNIVQWYNANDGKWHSTNDDLTDINHTMGFWIHMKTADTLIVKGTIPNTTSIQLYQGWNLVGNPSFCIHGIDDIVSSIATKYVVVQQYDSWDSSDPWKHYHINKPPYINDLAYMMNGRGYWLYVKEDCVWEVSNF